MTLLKALVEEIRMSGDEEVTMVPGEEGMGAENDTGDKQSSIVRFFTENPAPADEDVHQFAEEQGIDPDELEERVYALLHALLKGVGKHNDVPDEEFDPQQLQDGIEIEKEHTNNELVAKMIAKDHLSELPDYYTRLIDMEQGAKQPNDQFGDEESDYEDQSDDTQDEVKFKVGP